MESSSTQFSDDSFSTTTLSEKSTSVAGKNSANLLRLRELNSKISSRESIIGLSETATVKNDKIRYYYNKTICLRAPIQEILEHIEKLHNSTFAYLPQFPQTGDYSIIGTLFELIATVSTMVDWNSLNHACYWEDFCRETKQLSLLLDKVNGAALKCGDAAKSVLDRATEIFQGIVEPTQRQLRTENVLSYRTSTGGQSIQIQWKKPGDSIELRWHDADGGLLTVSLSQTGTGFRIRFLRHIIYHARACLELAYVTFLRVNIAITLHIPIEKLAKCQDVDMNKVTLQEHSFLVNAKRELDNNLDTIWAVVGRFKFQTFHLLKYADTLKKMRNSPEYIPKTAPTFIQLTMNVDDSLLMRVISSGIQAQAQDESFDFTVYPDRTEDIIAKVEDLLLVDGRGYKKFQQLLTLIKIILPKEISHFTSKERFVVDNEIQMILAHRFCVRRWLKKCITVFDKHHAFHKMSKVKLLPTLKDVSRKGEDACLDESTTRIWSNDTADVKDDNNNELPELNENWVTLEGDIKVTFNSLKGIMAKFPQKAEIRMYKELSLDEGVTLCIRLLRQLLFHVANEQCWAKIVYSRISETKSLVKRLKVKDRQDSSLQNAISEQHKHIRRMLKLTKAMRFLKE